MADVTYLLDSDLDAYIDNQLDSAGIIRVEKYLAKNPDAAAQVMADLAIKNSLKLALGKQDQNIDIKTCDAAKRLSSSLTNRQIWHVLRRIAAVGLFVSVGWIANTSIGTREVNASNQPPIFVEQAVRAHETSILRKTMISQPEVDIYDRDEIRAATAIIMPKLPNDWKVIDVQIFPSDYGPTVEASVITDKGEAISLFGVRPETFSVEPVTSIQISNTEVVWWQIGEVAYAVVSSTPDTGLTDEAEILKKSLY